MKTSIAKHALLLKQRLEQLDFEREHFRDETFSVVRASVDFFSSAGDSLDLFEDHLAQAQSLWKRARASIDSGKNDLAQQALAHADREARFANRAWRQYLGRNESAGMTGKRVCSTIATTAGTSLAGIGLPLLFGMGAGMAIGFGGSMALHAAPIAWMETKPQPHAPHRGKTTPSSRPDQTNTDSSPSALNHQQEATLAGKDTGDAADVFDGPIGARQQESTRIDSSDLTHLRAQAAQEPPTREAIIAKTQQQLGAWKRDGSDAMPTIGDLSIDQEMRARLDGNEETIDGLYEILQTRWSELIEGYRAILAKEGLAGHAAIRRVMDLLYTDYLMLYERDDARLTDYLLYLGGNCEARLKLVLATLSACGIELPEGQTFGVQVFAANIKRSGHVQPVLYDRQTNEVWDLMSGKVTNEVRAPIYDPHALPYAILKGYDRSERLAGRDRVDLVVSDDDLLIAMPTQVEGKSIAQIGSAVNVSTNSSLIFPKGINTYSDDDVPEQAYSASPYSESPSHATASGEMADAPSKTAAFPSGGSRDGEQASEGSRNTNKSKFAPRPRWETMTNDAFMKIKSKHDGGYIHRWDPDFRFVRGNGRHRILFRIPEQKEHFDRLETDAQRSAFILQLLHKSITAKLQQNRMKGAFALLDNPGADPSVFTDRIEGIDVYMTQSDRFVSASHGAEKHADTAVELFLQTKILDQFEEMSHSKRKKAIAEYVRSELTRTHPLYRLLSEKREQLAKRIEAHPEEFIAFIDRLTSKGRSHFFRFLSDGTTNRGMRSARKTNRSITAIANAIVDPTRIGVSDQVGRKQHLIYLNFSEATKPILGPTTPQRATKESPGQRGRANPRRERIPTSVVKPRTMISSEGMIHQLLWLANKDDHKAVGKRWNPLLSRTLLQIIKQPSGKPYRKLINGAIEALAEAAPESARHKEIRLPRRESRALRRPTKIRVSNDIAQLIDTSKAVNRAERKQEIQRRRMQREEKQKEARPTRR